MAYRWFRFAQGETLPSRYFEGPRAGQTFGPRLVHRPFDFLNLDRPDRGQVSQTLFDRPLAGGWAPVELGLCQTCREFLGFGGNAFELLAIVVQLGVHSP